MFSPKDILALDFDGVISDSIRECLVVAHNAFAAFARQDNRIEGFEQLDSDHVDKLRFMRNFIRSGEDYVYITFALNKGLVLQNQQEFDTFAEEYQNLREQFLDIFYKERQEFSQKKTAQWIRLNPLYEGMQEFLSAFPHKRNLYVITTKKTEFADKILKGNGVEMAFEQMLHATPDNGKDKIITMLLRKRNVAPARFYFVDDQVDTLLKVKSSGIHCILAEWGYNNPHQIELAEKNQIRKMKLHELYEYFCHLP